MKRLMIYLLSIMIVGNVFSDNRILKNELPKSEREFFENNINKQERKEELNNEVLRDNGDDYPKFLIRDINLSIITTSYKPLISNKKINKIVQEYEDRELDIEDIRELIGKLNNEYAKKGYITTKVYLEPEQNISDGLLKLVVLEGKVEDITLDDDTSKDKRKEFFAFTNERNKVLNIYHIDNGIDNINRVEQSNATLDIVPGEKQGYSKIIVKSNNKKPIRLNLGYEDTIKERQRYRVGLEYDNLLGMNDSLTFSYRGDENTIKGDKNKENRTRSYSVGYSFPIKSWSFRLLYDNSKDDNLVIGNTINYQMKEESKQYGINVSKLMYRDSGTKLYLNMGLDIKRDRTYLEGQRLNTQDRNTSVANIGISGISKLLNGISSYGLTYSRGLNMFGANKENSYNVGTLLTSPLYEDDNRYNFNKINMYSSYYKPFYFKNQGITTRLSISGQYTNNVLFNTEKYSIGSFDTIKGFRRSVSGDIGFSTKVDISYIFPTKEESKLGRFMYKLRPYVEYDFGKVRNNFDEYGNKKGRIATLSSYSLGVRYYGEILTLDMGLTKVDKGKSEVNGDDKRGYITVGMTF